jgi:capsular polysaccharide biosynthesis protein
VASPFARALRHQWPWVLVCLLVGLGAGLQVASSAVPAYTSVVRVLVDPADGNPFVPSPAAVRQDELTSLETEAQVAQSDAVLGDVVAQPGPLRAETTVTVPPNTQILEIAVTDADRDRARALADGVADAYLAHRSERAEAVNAERIVRVEARTEQVVADLRTASDAAQTGGDGERLFQTELAASLRNELVSLRAQRTTLENTEAPSGSVIAPATRPAAPGPLSTLLPPVGGALGGLLLGLLVAVLVERLRRVVRSETDVTAAGVPVLASVLSAPRREAVDVTVRRLRASVLALEPRPDVLSIAPVGRGGPDAELATAVASSFSRAGHRVVLVQVDGGGPEIGLAQLLTFERLDPHDLLQPSTDPLLSILPAGGASEQSRELLVAERLRTVLRPLVDAGLLVVVASPATDSPEAEAIAEAADLALVVVRTGRTRLPHLHALAAHPHPARGAVVLRRRDRAPLPQAGSPSVTEPATTAAHVRERITGP